MAKDKLLRGCRGYVGGYDISGDTREFSELVYRFGSVDVAGWGQDRNYLTDGVLQAGVSGYSAFVNDATGQSYSALGTVPATGEVTIAIGSGGAAPVAGDAAYLLPTVQLAGNVAFNDAIGLITADFMPHTDAGTTYAPLGLVLMPLTSLSATTDGSSIDNGAATTNGWASSLHVTATSSGNFSFLVQHSTDSSSWSTLGTFTLDGSAIGSEWLTGTGTINRYVRFRAARTAGTVSVICAFSRNYRS